MRVQLARVHQNLPVLGFTTPWREAFVAEHNFAACANHTGHLGDCRFAVGEDVEPAEVEGSKVFELYQAGKLDKIREYNLNDVRLTRKVYERMVASFGRQ